MLFVEGKTRLLEDLNFTVKKKNKSNKEKRRAKEKLVQYSYKETNKKIKKEMKKTGEENKNI